MNSRRSCRRKSTPTTPARIPVAASSWEPEPCRRSNPKPPPSKPSPPTGTAPRPATSRFLPAPWRPCVGGFGRDLFQARRMAGGDATRIDAGASRGAGQDRRRADRSRGARRHAARGRAQALRGSLGKVRLPGEGARRPPDGNGVGLGGPGGDGRGRYRRLGGSGLRTEPGRSTTNFAVAPGRLEVVPGVLETEGGGQRQLDDLAADRRHPRRRSTPAPRRAGRQSRHPPRRPRR